MFVSGTVSVGSSIMARFRIGAVVHVRRPTRRCWGFEDDRVGLTPKSRRGWGAGEAVDPLDAL